MQAGLHPAHILNHDPAPTGIIDSTKAKQALVVRSRFIADYREGILKQGAEFLHAKAAGLVDDEHVVGEIGQVLAGDLPGRQTADQITVYKSIGHIVQDLASVQALLAIPPHAG